MAGQAKPAQQRLPVSGRAAAQGRAGRLRRRRVTAGGEAPSPAIASWRSWPARERRRRSHPRRVAAGTPNSAQIRPDPMPCSAAAIAAAAMTPTASARRGAVHDGSRMCLALHAAHRPRRGRSRVLAPPRSRINRS